jgi:DNA invertase Pin-like site-specific DNA recombinase
MSKRTFQPQKAELGIPEFATSLPTKEPIAVYYRQSTEAQVGNISTEMQTIDMKAYLQQRGWSEDEILMIDMDEGISGSKKIDERPGMKTLFELITDRQIRAVACQDEDRLFRDVTQIQVNIFIEACRQSRVLVITPSFVYDFAHEQLGIFHARQFRFKCEMAAEYINTVIIGKLHRAKQRLMSEGRWAGATIPTGFMVDMRKTLPDGSSNPNWYKYMPFEPFAEVVCAYYRNFLEVGGNIAATLRRIRQARLSFPNPDTSQPPEGFATFYHLRFRDDGYYLGRSGLTTLLTNPAYIGHWCVQGAVRRWNNHPGIVSLEVFTQAFNYLSQYGLDGEKNTSYRPIRQNARPTLDSERPVERPLCAGLMYGLVNGEWRQVGTGYVVKRQRYAYELFERGFLNDRPIWERNAEWIDAAISRHFHIKLQATFDTQEWEEITGKFTQTLEHERKLKQAQVDYLESAKQNLITGLELASSPGLIRDTETRYEVLDQEQRHLKAELEAMENDHRQYERLRHLRGTFEDAINRWELMGRDEKHALLQMFAERIEVLEVKHLGGMRLRICWKNGKDEELRLNKMPTSGQGWTQDEVDQLLALVDKGASQVEIAAAFPARRWRQIRIKIGQLGKPVLFSPLCLRPDETYADFLERGGDTRSGRSNAHHWTKEDLTLLRKLVDGNAEQIEIMAAFSYRRWDHIRRKIKQVYQRKIRIGSTAGVQDRDTYQSFQVRHFDTGSAAGSRIRLRLATYPDRGI